MDVRNICVELQSLGVKVPQYHRGRKGGAGPAEGKILILKGNYINVPTRAKYVAASPYAIKLNGSTFVLFRKQELVGEICLPNSPRYYGLTTAEGVPFHKIALLHGKDCLASTTYQDCVYREKGLHCKFCGIGISLTNRSTILEKDSEELGLVTHKAMILDNIKHVTLTTGARRNEEENIGHLSCCVKSIKKRTNLPVHIQINPPHTIKSLDVLRDAGADTLGIHIETFDPIVLRKVAPSKAAMGITRLVVSLL
jgi:radical SAM protein (TIGR04043 family)